MSRFYLVAILALLPTAALCQPGPSDVPRPGTIQDPMVPINTIADGPPRSLIHVDVADIRLPGLAVSKFDQPAS